MATINKNNHNRYILLDKNNDLDVYLPVLVQNRSTINRYRVPGTPFKWYLRTAVPGHVG